VSDSNKQQIRLASFFTICRFHLNGMLHLNQQTTINTHYTH